MKSHHHQDVLSRVTNCIANTTRYPMQLLAPTADLENDLGIDSVKRVEIVAAMADEFGLDLVNEERDPSIRTIEQVANWVQNALANPGPSQANGAMGATLTDAANSPPASVPPAAVPQAPPAAPVPPAGLMPPASPAIPPQSRAPIAPNGMPNGMPNGAPPAAPSALRSEPPRMPGMPTNGHPHNGAGVHQNGSQFQNGPAQAPVPHEMPIVGAPQTLDGRVALVTGSGRGVGRTIARVLAARGATVVINSFHSRDQGEQTVADIIATGGKAIHAWGSVANPEQVNQIFDQIGREIGYLDYLVCNASDGKIGSFSDISQADWDKAFRTNVSGHHQCAMLASQLMQRRGGGSIITMSSIASQKYVEGLGGQGVIKAAVESMTRYLACDLAPLGIRTNCVSGGPVYGDLISMYPEARATHNYWESIIPDGQMCSPMDLASTIAFLLTEEARAINGAVWVVDHGASTRAHSRPLPQAARH